MMRNDKQISLALVDDSEMLRTIILRYLSGQGFDIVCGVGSGEELFDKIVELQSLPDICLLDAHLPGISGPEVSKKLNEEYPSIKIMAYSFFDEYDRPDKMLECGANAYVSKHAAPEELRDKLMELFRASHR